MFGAGGMDSADHDLLIHQDSGSGRLSGQSSVNTSEGDGAQGHVFRLVNDHRGFATGPYNPSDPRESMSRPAEPGRDPNPRSPTSREDGTRSPVTPYRTDRRDSGSGGADETLVLTVLEGRFRGGCYCWARQTDTASDRSLSPLCEGGVRGQGGWTRHHQSQRCERGLRGVDSA